MNSKRCNYMKKVYEDYRIDICTNKVKKGKLLCERHYKEDINSRREKCKKEDCKESPEFKGYCKIHNKCSVESCLDPILSKHMCNKHYTEFYRETKRLNIEQEIAIAKENELKLKKEIEERLANRKRKRLQGMTKEQIEELEKAEKKRKEERQNEILYFEDFT